MPDPAHAEDAPIEIRIRLRSAIDAPVGTIQFVRRIDLGAVWPEYPLPASLTAERLRAYYASDAPPTKQELHDLVETARAEGVLPLSTDGLELANPGVAFVAMLAARLAASHARVHEGAIEDGTSGIEDTSEVVALAQDVEARWPGHPVADHARLVLVDALFPLGGEGAPELALEALARIQTDEVAELALGDLTRQAFHLEDEDYALIDGIPTTRPWVAAAVAEFAIEEAVSHQDWGRVARWLPRLRDAIPTLCASPMENECRAKHAVVDDVAARLLLAEPRPATSWRQALTAAAWHCHLDTRGQEGTSTGEGSWVDDRWSWRWDGASTPVTRCLDRYAVEVPWPPPGTMVSLVLVGPDEGGHPERFTLIEGDVVPVP